MPGIFHVFLAAALTVVQIAFLSHLPTPFSDISFPLLSIGLATFVDRPVTAALWAFTGGLILDLHGIFPFGTELSVMLAIVFLTRLLFRRFITNASLAAAFLLSTVIIVMHTAMLLGLDGIRVVFGAAPFIGTQDADIGTAVIRLVIVNGLLTVALLAGSRRVKERFAHRFIIRT